MLQGWRQHVARVQKMRRVVGAMEWYNREEGKITRKKIYKRMVELARLARARVLHRHEGNKQEMRVFKTVRSNHLLLKDMQEIVGLRQSKAVYVVRKDWWTFREEVGPFVGRCCAGGEI